jgi:Sigma-70, region 4
MPFTNLGKKNALDGQLDIIHEVMGLGNLGLLAAVEHWNPELGKFSTIANFWIRKFIREGTKDIFGIEGLVSPLYLPKRHMALFTVGLTGTKSVHRSDDDGGDYEIDLLDSEGRTSRKYLQRHIGEGGARFLWCDEGTHACPRIKLPGHPSDEASRDLVSEPERAHEQRRRAWEDSYFFEGVEDVARRVLSPIELRVFRARFLNKNKPTHKALGAKLGLTEGGIRKIKERAARKVFAAPRKPGSMTDYYRVPPLSDLDEWLDLTAKRFPNATNKDRREAWRAIGVVPAEISYLDKRCGSFNSWDFVKDTPWEPEKPVKPKFTPWRVNCLAFSVEYFQRFKGRVLPEWSEPLEIKRTSTFESRFGRPWKAGQEWLKPTYEEEVLVAALAA